MRCMMLLRGTIACLTIAGYTMACPQSAPMVVELEQLVHSPEKFDGKLVSVSGFMLVASNPHDIRAVILHQDERPVLNPNGISVLVDLSSSHLDASEGLKSGWVEITARAGVIRAGGGKRGAVLREVRNIQRIR